MITPPIRPHHWGASLRAAVALSCAFLLAPGEATLLAQTPAPAPPSTAPPSKAPPSTAPPSNAPASKAPAAADQPKKLPADQLDSLVAPIALYPDPLLAQTLAASTYPLEVVQLQQWMAKNKDLKDKALADAVGKQPWDPSIQALAAFPDVVKRLADDVQWTADLGNAVLAQESDVMDAVQRMRKKAKDKGTLTSNEQQKVETQVVEKKEVIVIESASPSVIYVPSYDPVVVYGPPIYPYPPIYYPYYPVGAAFVSFGIGIMWGAMWGGWWGGCHWGGSSNININVNNNFNRVDHHGGNRGNGGAGNRGDVGGGNRGQPKGGGAGGGNKWGHNPSHRGGTPYGDRATASKFGGNARGDSLSSRQAGARQQISRNGAPSASNRASAGAGNRGGAGAGNRPSAGTSNRGGSGGGSFNRAGGSDSIGGRNIGSGSSRGPSGFGGGAGGGFNGAGSRASGARGAGSFGGSRGGGGGGRRR